MQKNLPNDAKLTYNQCRLTDCMDKMLISVSRKADAAPSYLSYESGGVFFGDYFGLHKISGIQASHAR